MTVRRLLALTVLALALGTAVFGVVRGLSQTGPASGVRLVVAIAPPVDDAAREIAEHVVKTRAGMPGLDYRVVPAGDGLIVELGTAHPVHVTSGAELAFAIDGHAHATARVDRVDASGIHVVTPGANEDRAI